MYSCKRFIILASILFSFSATAIDLPESVMLSTTYELGDGASIQVTTALINDNSKRWGEYFSKILDEDYKANPKMFFYAETLTSKEGRGVSQDSEEDPQKLADDIIKKKAPIKHDKLAPSFWSKTWKHKNNPFQNEYSVRMNATVIRFIMNGTVNAAALMVGDAGIPVTAAIAGGVLIGSLSASTAWYFDFIADVLVGEPKITKWLYKVKSEESIHRRKGLGVHFSAWVENLFKWGLVELTFTSLIKIGFIVLGIEAHGEFMDQAMLVLSSTGLATLSQGIWEESIMRDRKLRLKEGDSPALVQKNTQMLALVGSVLSVMGNMANIFHLKVGTFAPGKVVLATLLAAGVVNLARVEKEHVMELGKKISNRCSKLLEVIKKGIKKSDSDQSSIWETSEVTCRV